MVDAQNILFGRHRSRTLFEVRRSGRFAEIVGGMAFRAIAIATPKQPPRQRTRPGDGSRRAVLIPLRLWKRSMQGEKPLVG